MIFDKIQLLKKSSKKIKKTSRLIAGFLVAIQLGNVLSYLPMEVFQLPEAHAAENEVPNDQLGIIAVLAESSLMEDFNVRSRVMTYAENAQSRIPHSKAVVIEVDKNESTFRIAALLEKLYFEGVDTDAIDANPLNNDSELEDDNQLLGVVIVGDVPLPVVHEEDGTYLPSLYPYTDFYQKAYIYDHQTDQFEANPQAQSKTPEVWHGVIIPPSKDPEEAKKQLMAYFDKNNAYSKGEDGFADFEQRLLYANFPEMEKQMNLLDYGNYQRYNDYMEEMVFRRFNKYLLKDFIARVSKDMESDTPVLNDQMIETMPDIQTESIFKQYALPLLQALRTYRGDLNETVEKTGRWSTGQVDSPESLITFRDEYAKTQLHRSQLLLEKAVNDFIETSIPEPDRALDLVTGAQLTIQLRIEDQVLDNHLFNFFTATNGIPMSTVTTMDQCNIQRGTEKDPNIPVLEDNSVLVNANRLYSIESLLTPPLPPEAPDENWQLEAQQDYKDYAGCVFNNSIENPQTGANPLKCLADQAVKSLFDIRGSMEVKPGEPVYDDENRCSVEDMTFLAPDPAQLTANAALGNLNNTFVSKNLTDIVNEAYAVLQGNLLNPTFDQKASFVFKALIESNQPLVYSPQPTVQIELVAIPQEKPIESIYPHIEPRNETISAIKYLGESRVDPNTGELNIPPIITPSLPADGKRFVSFFNQGDFETFDYINLFRIEGLNRQEIIETLLNQMVQKQAELQLKTDTATDLFETFFTENASLLEPLTWKGESLDQKLKDIIPKYIDRDSEMPSPAYNPPKSPQNKPEGYEVLHIVAEGDAHGYQFGLNRAMQAQSPTFKEAKEQEEAVFEEEKIQKQAEQGLNNPQLPPGNYVCGDPKGVEIWEWFGALQCWVEEEVVPKQDLFALSSTCTAAPGPEGNTETEETPPQPPITIFDELLTEAADFTATFPQKNLVIGQEGTLTLSALDAQGQTTSGYIDTPIHLALSDPSIIEFSENDFHIFTSQKNIQITAKTPGTTELTITMGDLPPKKITITVFETIQLKWQAQEQKSNGKSEFLITLRAEDAKGEPLTDLETALVLASENPGDGTFENEGKILLKNGVGQIRFTPAPGKQKISLISQDQYLKSEPFVITPTKAEAVQLVLKSNASLVPVGKEVEIEVVAADEFGFPVNNFNQTVNLSLPESSKSFAALPKSSVNLKEGRGIFVLRAGAETADVTVNALHSELQPATLTVPILARVEAEEWKQIYPQTLFASLVGFPAGDVTREDYFGGVQLMAGKTQAVYSFLTTPTAPPLVTIDPNHFIRLTDPTRQTVLADLSDDHLVLQAFNQETAQTLFTQKEVLNFEAVEILPEGELEGGKMYLEMLDSNYAAEQKARGFSISSKQSEPLLDLQKTQIHVLNPNFKWQYVNDPEFGAIELQLTDGLITPLRLILNFKPEVLAPSDFSEINPQLKIMRSYGGNSTRDAGGLSFIDTTAELPEAEREEFYGLEGDHKYLSLFASGMNLGEAMKFNMPVSGIVLGDPTIKLETGSTNNLNYNSATGEKLYQDAQNIQIRSINHFNFNNDAYEDVAVLLEDGRVRLLEGGPTEPPYKDRGDLAQLVDGGIALETLDLKQDGYEDLLVATQEGRLALLNNEQEVITRRDQKLSVGKQIKKLFLEDMDLDGGKDLVVLDSRGDLSIFYYNQEEQKFPQTGKLVGNYGLSLKLGQNLNTDLDLRFAGIPEPQGLTDDTSDQSQAPLETFEGGGEIDPQKAQDFVEKLQQENDALAQNPYAGQTTQVPKLPWPEGNEVETYFAPIESLNTLGASKTISNKDRPGEKSLDLEERTFYQIELNPSASFSSPVLADVVPDTLTFDPNSLKCVEGPCQDVQVQQNGVQLFFSQFNLDGGQKVVFTYEAQATTLPQADFYIKTVDEPNENLANPNEILDDYKDILVSPPFNNTGKVLIHYTTNPRTYAVIQSNDPKLEPADEAVQGFADMMKQMEMFQNGNYDPENPPQLKTPGLEDAINESTGAYECLEDPNIVESCTEKALDEVAEAMTELSCVGGGCFPMPFNKAFLVPPNMPIPTLAFPTTLPTTVGPVPYVWPGSFIGASNVPGPIQSQMRVYFSPTLTGGMGIATCFGPYPLNPNVPPPIFPIPYPPPTGNCMVTVIPAENLYFGLCAEIAKRMDKMMDLIASGVNKVDSAINSVNNNPNIPLNVQPTGPNQGAGGLEVSLAANLGNALKFEPPLKTFSNIHLTSFDSIGGVVANWLDRQLLEIQQKLLTLPTFSIYLPDTKSMFTADFDKTQKRFEGWYNTMNGSAAATLDNLSDIGNSPTGTTNTTGYNWSEKMRSGLETFSDSKVLQYKQAIDTQASIYNLNALEGLYDVASTLPLVKLTEKPIQLNVPWMSAGEIQAYILQLQNWIIYYEQEYDRVKDKWEALSCDDKPDPKTGATFARNSAECVGRKLADAFGASFDEFILSAKQNIEVLQSYLEFPKKLAAYKAQLAGYVNSVACYIDVLAQMMGGYLATIKQQMIQWAETILTIKEIVKNIKELFDVFTNFEDSCETCMNERYGNFGWWALLGLVLPDLPIIQFPKIPDIVLDLSKTEMQLDIELPVLNIRPQPIPLPPLPYVKLPDFPNVGMFLQIPALPVLPKLPELPPLPALPPVPIMDLPTLPPPPKLPDVGQAFEKIIPLIEKILQTWCLIKKSLAPVPEQMLGTQIATLTNRPAYLIPLDLLQVQAPKIALFDLGFNQLRLEVVTYIGLRITAPSKALEELGDTWNGWMEVIPENMNAAYRAYLAATEGKVQEGLDAADSFMENKAIEFEEAFDEYVQGWLDKKVGDPLQEADEWLRNQEAVWQEQADAMGVDLTYEQYYRQINQVYNEVRNLKNEAVTQWFEENQEIIQGLNYLIPGTKTFELLADEDFKAYQQEMLDVTSDKLLQAGNYGPTLFPRLYACLRYFNECQADETKFFGKAITPEELEKLKPDEGLMEQVNPLPQLPQPPPSPQNPQALVPPSQNATASELAMAQSILETPEGQELSGLFDEISQTILSINQAEPVEYTVLKEKFGVPDYEVAPRSTTVDKLQEIQQELQQHSESLYAQATEIEKAPDFIAFFGPAPEHPEAYLVAEENVPEVEPRVMTSAIDPPKLLANNNLPNLEEQVEELQEKINENQKEQAIPQADPTVSTLGCTADFCLPDPITQKAVPVIPSIELLPASETVFMPNGHLVYSDGTGLYLKRDLTLEETEENVDAGSPQLFTLEEMREKMRMEEAPKEALNMLQSQLVENGSATFNWMTPNRPDVYGYGLEIERTLTGFDSNQKTNPIADVKVVLLPPDEEGNEPAAFVGDTQIGYGTLVTSLPEAEVAQKRFGIQARTTITNATEVYFPSLNNAKIDVSDYKAVYFDQADGSGYSMEMENGFYHLKMTWFDRFAQTGTYTQNEILAPQAAAGDDGPLLINNADKLYVPIYKEKLIKASEVFSDFSGAYNYYWFLGDNPEPKMGSQILLPPAYKLGQVKLKLVASLDIEDQAATPFEKEFTVEVFAPELSLDQQKLSEGLIAGQMSTTEEKTNDLSEIPFSVFRNRGGTWKNVGLLHAQDASKPPTVPPLNDHEGKKYPYSDSYYSVGTEGNYEITGFDILDETPLIIKDNQGNKVAEVLPGSGTIVLTDPEKYELKAMPATETLPTRIVILLKATQEIIGNIYYVADRSRPITLVKTELNYPNVAQSGVTVGDHDIADQIVVQPLPDNAPSLPGGAVIFDQTSQKVIALLGRNGAIHLLDQTYELGLKNGDQTDDPYIFELLNSAGKASEMDIFIQTEGKSLTAEPGNVMDETSSSQASENGTGSQVNQSLLPESSSSATLNQSLLPKLPTSPFTDVPTSHPYYDEIMELYTSDVVRGFNDNSFRPNLSITRGEFIKIALGVTNCFDCEKATDPQIARYNTNPFPDVSLPAWYFYCVWVAKELQMITGYGDGQFRPERNISRAEAAAVLLRQADVQISPAPPTAFQDVPDYAWYKDYVYTAVELGMIPNQNGFVEPDEAITRGEFAFMAVNLKNFRQCRLVDEDLDGNFDWWEMSHNLDPLRPDADQSCPCTDNPNRTDTDKDGLKDVCDLDIDGDGTLNPMCVFDAQGNFSEDLVEAKAGDLGDKEVVDNCVLTPNPDQQDYDNNGVGDICEACPCEDNPNATDTDKDGMKDVCDVDIDNDGQKNPMCIFDGGGFLDPKKAEPAQDNCIFVANQNQKDVNQNGIGDACETGDLCPAIPEDLDGVADEDGCPEVDDGTPEKQPGIYVTPGPLCGLLDFKADIMPGDIFMTAITDLQTHDVVFSRSNEVTYQ